MVENIPKLVDQLTDSGSSMNVKRKGENILGTNVVG